MSRDYRLYLKDIVDACEKVRRYTEGLDFGSFTIEGMTVDAVVRNLEIIGEAVKNIPQELRDLQPQIDWKNAARFRDIIAHYYFKVDYEVVWSLVGGRIDEIDSAARAILDTMEPLDDR